MRQYIDIITEGYEDRVKKVADAIARNQGAMTVDQVGDQVARYATDAGELRLGGKAATDFINDITKELKAMGKIKRQESKHGSRALQKEAYKKLVNTLVFRAGTTLGDYYPDGDPSDIVVELCRKAYNKLSYTLPESITEDKLIDVVTQRFCEENNVDSLYDYYDMLGEALPSLEDQQERSVAQSPADRPLADKG